MSADPGEIPVQAVTERVVEHRWVQVGTCPEQHDLGVFLQVQRSQIRFVVVGAEQSLHGRIQAQGLLDGERDEVGVGLELGQFLRFREQTVEDVRKHDRCRRTPRREQEAAEAEDLGV